MTLDRYQFTELLCVQWNPEMAARFPHASHAGCRQLMQWTEASGWQPHDPPMCSGYHCNRCGAPTNMFGHHDCPDRPNQ